MVALPQFVFGHVSTQRFVTRQPLRAARTRRGKATRAGSPTGRRHHGDLPSTPRPRGLFLVFGVGAKEENAGKSQWTPKDPNGIGKVFHARIDGLQTVGTLTTDAVQAAAALPTVGARRVDTSAREFHGALLLNAGNVNLVLSMARRKKDLTKVSVECLFTK